MRTSQAFFKAITILSLVIPTVTLAQSLETDQKVSTVQNIDKANLARDLQKSLQDINTKNDLLGKQTTGSFSRELFKKAQGGMNSGGGDLCEDRIQIIREDLRSWINQGGAQGLQLPAPLTVQQYSTNMLKEIDQAKIRCVGPKDQGYPVAINGTPKVCRFDRNWLGRTQITCDAEKFQAINESDQYILVHHEYAGLAGVEQPNLDDSTYGVSNQISGYLVDTIVKKLAVKSQRSDRKIDEETRTLSTEIGELIVKTKFSDCSTKPEHLSDGVIGLYLWRKDGSGQIWYYPRPDERFFGNTYEIIKPSAPGLPLELRISGHLAPISPTPKRLSIFIYLDSSERKLLQVVVRSAQQVSKNVGTVLNPVYKDVWELMREDFTCTAEISKK